MGTGEMGTPAKTTKTSMSQEQPCTGTAVLYPDWAAFQAYYNSGTPPPPPPGYFHSSVSPTPQHAPYIWGAQSIMSPYGNLPPPYAAMYHHGGMYTHPSMPPGAHPFGPYVMASTRGAIESAPGGTISGTDVEGKPSEAKNPCPLKRSKGSLGSLNVLTVKANESVKRTGRGGNCTISQSGESASEGSSERSDENSQNGSRGKMGFEQNSAEAPETQNATAASYSVHGSSVCSASGAQATNSTVNLAVAAVPISIATKLPTAVGPTTNLNIGMDYWSGSCAVTSTMRGKRSAVAKTTTMVPSPQSMSLVVPRDAVPPDLWLQDEREVKRQRRKQSNRESARRSRLRKQAECEELAHRVESLKAENLALRTELNQVEEECRKLSTKNTTLRKKMQKGPQEEARISEMHGEAGKGQQQEQLNNTDSSANESVQNDGGRDETAFNLDERNRSLDSRSQSLSVSAG